MHSWVRDLRFSLRLLAKSKLFAIAAMVTLALGIGANSAVFSLFEAAFLRPLPYADPERLVMVWNQLPSTGLPKVELSGPEFLDYRSELDAFAALAAFDFPVSANLTGVDQAERLQVARVSGDFFAVLGREAIAGRSFGAAEDRPGAEKVVVLSQGLWQRRFGADPKLVGRTLTIDGESHVVLGVMPADVDFPQGVEAWIPLGLDPARPGDRESHTLQAIARLSAGSTLATARARVADGLRRLEESKPEHYGDAGAGLAGLLLVGLRDEMVGSLRLPLLVVLAGAALVLLVACANVVNLLLARAHARETEIALRAALGGRAREVARLYFCETLILTLGGGAAGLLLASVLLRLGPAVPIGGARLGAVGLDARVLGFAVLISFVAAGLTALVPALKAMRTNLATTLQDGQRQAGGGRRHRTLRLVLVGEVALATVLAISAGLLIRSFFGLSRVDPGFRTEGVLTFQIAPAENRYPGFDKAPFYERLLERLARVPGVEAVGMISNLPFAGSHWSGAFTVEQPGSFAGERPVEADWRTASPGYFEALGIPLIAGRMFRPDDRAGEPWVMLIDEHMARAFWPGEEAVGKRLQIPGSPWFTVVGVVGDVQNESLGSDSRVHLYFSHLQLPTPTAYVTLRTTLEPTSMVETLRRAVAEVDPEQPVFEVRTLAQVLAGTLSKNRFATFLLAGFAALALLLACVGVYAVMSYLVGQRTREIGLRIALGALPSECVGQVVRQAAVLTLVGIGIGLAVALAATRVLSSLLFEISPRDPLILGATALVLGAVGLLAGYLPARAAARVDPTTALRAS